MAKKKPEKPKKARPTADCGDRSQMFIVHYIANGGNASRAAISAGYKNREEGYRLISKPIIWGEITKRRQALIDKLSLKSEDLLKEAAIIAYHPEINGYTGHAKLNAIELIHKHTGQGSYKKEDGDGASREAGENAFDNANERLFKRFAGNKG